MWFLSASYFLPLCSDVRIDSPLRSLPLRDCSASEGESDEREAAFIHLSFRAPPRSHGFPTRSAGSAVEAQFLLFPFQIQPFFSFFLSLCLMFYFRLVNHLSRHQRHSFISLDCRVSRLRECRVWCLYFHICDTYARAARLIVKRNCDLNL